MGELGDLVGFAETRPRRAQDLPGMNLNARIALAGDQFMWETFAAVSKLLREKAQTTEGLGHTCLGSSSWKAKWETPVPGTFNDTKVTLDLLLGERTITTVVGVGESTGHRGSVGRNANPDQVAADVWSGIKSLLDSMGRRAPL